MSVVWTISVRKRVERTITLPGHEIMHRDSSSFGKTMRERRCDTVKRSTTIRGNGRYGSARTPVDLDANQDDKPIVIHDHKRESTPQKKEPRPSIDDTQVAR